MLRAEGSALPHVLVGSAVPRVQAVPLPVAGAIFRAVLQWRVVPWPGAAGSRLLAQGLTYTKVPAWEKSTRALLVGLTHRVRGCWLLQGLALGDARSGCAKGLGFDGGEPSSPPAPSHMLGHRPAAGLAEPEQMDRDGGAGGAREALLSHGIEPPWGTGAVHSPLHHSEAPFPRL